MTQSASHINTLDIICDIFIIDCLVYIVFACYILGIVVVVAFLLIFVPLILAQVSTLNTSAYIQKVNTIMVVYTTVPSRGSRGSLGSWLDPPPPHF